MGYRIRQIGEDAKLTERLSFETITRVVGMEMIQKIVKACGVTGQRERRLPGWLTVLMCIGMNLYSELGQQAVMRQILQGARLLQANDEEDAPTAGALSQARDRVGVKALERLFKAVCRPIATTQTRGAFAYGLRLVALDGSIGEMPDSAVNSAYFGRSGSAFTTMTWWSVSVRGGHSYWPACPLN